ncbi:hypothetical protein [Methanomethylovorans sp.]|uniref:hypothetical protein n=1 Tax=Methanomethylovorans sp. TaxID=2758717 RepID=UPI00345EB82D
MIVPREYLVAFLNSWKEISQNIDVIYPPIGKLFTISIGEKCTIVPISSEDYRIKRNGFLAACSKDKILGEEIPTADDLRTCFFASFILGLENYGKIRAILQEAAKRNHLKGEKLFFIGYDTNALRFRLNAVIEGIISELYGNAASKIGHCLSEVVKGELRRHWDRKYDQPEISRLKQDFMKNFLNQPPKAARMARLGAVEYKHLMAQINCQEISSRGYRGYGDNAIIKSYEFFRDKNNVDICLISGDNNFTAMAHEEKMQAVYVKQPTSYGESMDCTWDQAVDLVYITAIVFGYLLLGEVNVYGIWRGKVEDDWDKYRLSIDANDANLKGELFRDMRILENGGYAF